MEVTSSALWNRFLLWVMRELQVKRELLRQCLPIVMLVATPQQVVRCRSNDWMDSIVAELLVEPLPPGVMTIQ